MQDEVVLIGLLALALVFYIRNAVELAEVHRLSLRVKRRAHQAAALCGFVSGLNSEVIALAKEKEIPIKQGDIEPPYWQFIKSRGHRRNRQKRRAESRKESRE